MINIESILSNEVGEDMTVTEKQLAYLFTKFLLANGAYRNFVREYVKYHESKLRPKDVIIDSIRHLKSDGRAISELILAYSSAFDWWDTSEGNNYWSTLNSKWYNMTKKRFLGYFMVK